MEEEFVKIVLCGNAKFGLRKDGCIVQYGVMGEVVYVYTPDRSRHLRDWILEGSPRDKNVAVTAF